LGGDTVPAVSLPQFRRLEREVGVSIAAIAALFVSGPTWLAAAEQATAARLGDPMPWAPGYGALAMLAQLVPIGEAATRVALVSAVAAGLLAAGVIAMARALVPREVGAGVGAVLALAAVGVMRIAATSPGPAILVAAGVAWATAGVVALRRGEDGAGRATAGVAIALAAAPWIGVALAVLAAPLVWRRRERRALLLVPMAVIAPLVLVLGVPPLGDHAGLRARALVEVLGADAGVVVLGAGALGLLFGAATGLRGAGAALGLLVLVAAGAIASPIGGGDAAIAVQTVLALGIAVLATAGVRAAARESDGARRALVALVLSLPFALLGAGLAGSVPRDGDAVPRVASDLADPAPAGPGAIFVGGDELMTALRYERAVAGLRPDLALGPRVDGADVVAVNLMRQGRIVVADQPAFGALDDRLARPLYRGFELLLERGVAEGAPPAPATYPGPIGAQVAARLALARGIWEAAGSHLDDAVRAIGFVGTRFDASAVALLAATRPSANRPALFAFVPALGTPDARMWLDLLGDDIAWVAGIAEPPLPSAAAPERHLHARWRAILLGLAPPADPAVAALGDVAVAATREMLTKTGRTEAADKLAP
jgi:hypothetical protein